jgi:hypothetical protein
VDFDLVHHFPHNNIFCSDYNGGFAMALRREMKKIKLTLAPKNVPDSRFVAFSALVFALIFSSLGAAGSYGTRVQSFFVWTPTIVIAIFFLTLTHLFLRKKLKFNFWIVSILEGIVGSLFFAPFAYFIDVFLGLDPGPYLSLNGIVSEFGNVLPSVVICWLLMKSPRYFGLIFPAKITQDLVRTYDTSSHGKVSSEIIGTFLEMLPKELGTDVIFIKAEKQYIMVTTSLGSKLIHYSLTPAINSFAEDYGFRIHRSIWVARKHVLRIDKKMRTVKMSNDAILPISRRLLSTIGLPE